MNTKKYNAKEVGLRIKDKMSELPVEIGPRFNRKTERKQKEMHKKIQKN